MKQGLTLQRTQEFLIIHLSASLTFSFVVLVVFIFAKLQQIKVEKSACYKCIIQLK